MSNPATQATPATGLSEAAQDILCDVDDIVAGWQKRLDGPMRELWLYGQSYFPVMVGLVRALQRENAQLRAALYPACDPTDAGSGDVAAEEGHGE